MQSETVAIVGAGPAGMRAAQVLAEHGLRPVILDEAPASGGQIYRRQAQGLNRSYKELYGFEAADALRFHVQFDRLRDRIDYRPNTLVWHVGNRELQILQSDGGAVLAFDRLLLATGAMDRVIPFPGWTLPGIYTLGGAQVALKHQACAIGRRVVFFGSSPLLPLVALQYAKAGVDVAAVLDTAPFAAKRAALPGLLAGGLTGYKGLYYVGRLAMRGIRYCHGIRPIAALGNNSVDGFEYQDASGRSHKIECDAVAFGYGLKSEWQLADLAGCRFAFDPTSHQWRVAHDPVGRTSVERIYVAGDGARIAGAQVAALAGEAAAMAILVDMGKGKPDALDGVKRRLEAGTRLRGAIDRAFPFPAHLAQSVPDDCSLCRCEAISAGEFRASLASLTPHDINRAKAFSRAGMGRCQGRVCAPSAAEIMAAACGISIEDAGRMRSQPPVKPLPIAAFAASLGETVA